MYKLIIVVKEVIHLERRIGAIQARPSIRKRSIQSLHEGNKESSILNFDRTS
jgi:hypothetical protein